MDEQGLAIKQMNEEIIILKTEGKTKDREIKELKEKVEVLTTSFNSLALTNQSILSKVDNLAEKFNPIITYIEELKKQPQKDKDKFIWLLISGLVGVGFLALGVYLGIKN